MALTTFLFLPRSIEFSVEIDDEHQSEQMSRVSELNDVHIKQDAQRLKQACDQQIGKRYPRPHWQRFVLVAVGHMILCVGETIQ